MKKIFILYLAIICFLFTPAMADTTVDATATSEFINTVSSNDTYNSTNVESPNLIQANANTGMNVGIPGAYRNRAEILSILPKIFGDFEFNVLSGTSWNKYGMDIIEVQNVANWWWINTAIATGHNPIETSSDKIILLPYIPEGPNVKRVSYSYIKIEDHDDMPFRAMYEGIEKGWKAGGKPKYCTMMYKVTPTSRGEVAVLGTAAVTSAAHAGSGMPGKDVSSGAFGAGFGSAESSVWDSGYYFAIFWNKDQEKKVQPTIAQKLKNKTNKVEVKELVSGISKNVTFEQDSYALNTEEQLNVVAGNSKIISERFKTLGPGEKIWIIGCTSDEGTDEYNLILGENRAHVTAAAYSQLLKKLGYSEEYLQEKIRYLSMGEIFPGYKKLENNRRTFLLVGSEL